MAVTPGQLVDPAAADLHVRVYFERHVELYLKRHIRLYTDNIIGPLPTAPHITRSWIRAAARIEAYREKWGVEPQRLRERPLDACQEQGWKTAVRTAELLARRAPVRSVQRSVDHGMELGW